jgi:hypothetical protein
MEFIKDRLYINRNLQPAIILSLTSIDNYPINIELLNKADHFRALTKDGSYLGSGLKSENDILTDIPLYEYKNEHVINDIFHLSIYDQRRMIYTSDNGISYDNKHCAINILSTYQIKNIKNKFEKLHYRLGAIHDT